MRGAPANALKQTRIETAQADQVIAAIAARTEDGVADLQFCKGFAQSLRREQGRIGADDDESRIMAKENPKGVLEALPQIQAALTEQAKLRRQAGKRRTGLPARAGQKYIARNRRWQGINFPQGVANQRRVQSGGALCTQQRNESSLGPARRGRAREDGKG